MEGHDWNVLYHSLVVIMVHTSLILGSASAWVSKKILNIYFNFLFYLIFLFFSPSLCLLFFITSVIKSIFFYFLFFLHFLPFLYHSFSPQFIPKWGRGLSLLHKERWVWVWLGMNTMVCQCIYLLMHPKGPTLSFLIIFD